MMAASGDELNWKRMASLRRPDRNQMLREKKTFPVDCVGSIRVRRFGSHEQWSSISTLGDLLVVDPHQIVTGPSTQTIRTNEER
jgi:hypothetical protein